MRIRFECDKDPLLAQHYAHTFGEHFQTLLNAPDQEPDTRGWLIEGFVEAMIAEADRQEHYDYETDEQGHRTLIHDEEGHIKLLIPAIVIEPDIA